MEASARRRAIEAAAVVAAELGLAVDDVALLSNSNRLVLRLLPCDVVARVSVAGWFSAAVEVDLVRCLAEQTIAPVARLEPRVAPLVYAHDGFDISLWEHFDAEPSEGLRVDDYTTALEDLHAALRAVEVTAPHFSDRLEEARRWVMDETLTPELLDVDRELIAHHLSFHGPVEAEQLLHGEPHPGNTMATSGGVRFIDFESCVRGPVEWDLAWVPKGVSDRYQGTDQGLVAELRGAVIALVVAHRWRADDRHPSGRPGGVVYLDALRLGPPWRPDEVTV